MNWSVQQSGIHSQPFTNAGYYETGRRHSRESSIQVAPIYASIPPLVAFCLAHHGIDSRRLTLGSYTYTKPVRVPVTCPSTLRDIVYEEWVERLIKHEAKPSALLGLETHSSYTISRKVLGWVLYLVCRSCYFSKPLRLRLLYISKPLKLLLIFLSH